MNSPECITERCIAELDALRAELDRERAIVDRIWAQFGTPSYEALKGRTIYELIDEVKSERDALRAVLREILEEVNSSTSRLPRSLIERAEKLLGGES